MPANISGVVFNDTNRNGVYDATDTGISNVSVTLFDTNSICSTTITDLAGLYTFDGITISGVYKIYETVTNPIGCPPTVFTQPSGYDQSTTQRVQSVSITAANISGNTTLTLNFGHETVTSTIPCTSNGIQFAYATTPTSYINIDLVTGNVTNTGFINPISISCNAIGYNQQDSLIYGFDQNSIRVVRCQGDKIATTLASIPNMPAGQAFNTGDVSANGYLYLYNRLLTKFYVVDVVSNRATFLKLVNPNNSFQEQTSNFGVTIASTNLPDWVFSNVDGQLYAIITNTGNAIRINPNTGVITPLITTGLPSVSAFGALFSTSNGQLYGINNNDGVIYRVTISGNNASAQRFSQSSPFSNNDGASCAKAELPIDFGDCPDTTTIPFISYHNYRSTLAKDGPRHGITPSLVFGVGVTAESDALQNPTATGDSLDDGVGVLPLPPMQATATSYVLPITVTNNTGDVANIYAWLDFNNNGIFQGNEAYTTTVPSILSVTQAVTLTFSKPVSTTLSGDLHFIRMRITTNTLINTNAGNLTLEDTRSYGPASDGEVEDYPLYITNIMSTNPQKSVDKTYAAIGDKIKYTLSIPNQGTTSMINVSIIDTIPNGTSFVTNSLTLNNVTISGANPQPPSGYFIGTIPRNQTYTVTFQVLVQTIPNPNSFTNNFQLFYNYLLDDKNGPTIPGTAISTTTPSTTINTAKLIINKSVDKNYVTCLDTLNYTISYTNIGNVNAQNVVFIDTIPNGTQFVNNSFTVDGITISGANPSIGVNLDTILAGSTSTITFQVILIC